MFTELRAAGPESQTSARSVMGDGCMDVTTSMQLVVRFHPTASGMESAMNHGNDPYDHYGGDWFSGDPPQIVVDCVQAMLFILAASCFAVAFR